MLWTARLFGLSFFAPFLYLNRSIEFVDMKKLLNYGSNFYVLSVLFFLFWMIFIDSNNLVNHVRMSRQMNQLEDQKEFYLEKKEKIKAERMELMSNPQLLEKFARERYLMKKTTEDLYVIVEK